MNRKIILLANYHRALQPGENKHRLFAPGETVVVQEGPYGDFGDDESLVVKLAGLAFGVGALSIDAYNQTLKQIQVERDVITINKGSDESDWSFLIEQLLEDLNAAVEESDIAADPCQWGYHEGTIFFHRMSWWAQGDTSPESDADADRFFSIASAVGTHAERTKQTVQDVLAQIAETLKINAPAKQQWIVAFGNVGDGYGFEGPFTSVNDATAYGDATQDGSPWNVLPLDPPKEIES